MHKWPRCFMHIYDTYFKNITCMDVGIATVGYIPISLCVSLRRGTSKDDSVSVELSFQFGYLM